MVLKLFVLSKCPNCAVITRVTIAPACYPKVVNVLPIPKDPSQSDADLSPVESPLVRSDSCSQRRPSPLLVLPQQFEASVSVRCTPPHLRH